MLMIWKIFGLIGFLSVFCGSAMLANCFRFTTADANCNGASILIELKPTYDQALDIQRKSEISQLAQKHFWLALFPVGGH
jgi:hypothetical protein